MSNDDMQGFGEKIARLRKRRRWTQRELADRMHIHQSMVTRWEKGQVAPRNDTLERLATTFEITVDELLSPIMSLQKVSAPVDDPEMRQLFSEASALEGKDREVLKAVIEAMLVRRRVKELSLGLAG
jgi:transcriptional regulator with XRE-family HTH domain